MSLGAVALLRASGALCAATPSKSAGEYVVFIRTPRGELIPVEVDCAATVASLERAAELSAGVRCRCEWPAHAGQPAVPEWPSVALAFAGEVLSDPAAALSDCGIGPESVLEVVRSAGSAADAPLSLACRKRLVREMRHHLLHPPEGVRWRAADGEPIGPWVLELAPADLGQTFVAEVDGAAETPYAGWTFPLDVFVPTNYPFRAPRVRFACPVFHPLVEPGSGEICLDILGPRWHPHLTLDNVLMALRDHITGVDPRSQPSLEDAAQAVLNLDAGRLWREDPAAAARTAAEWSERYALPRRAA
eukprot:TRINITY_DN34038_c0_g1_i1.p1 TRINITY_DN34038_c0_g1~~TRINITY_DN34038_c0_g1_i1.p1  ORF type:complete len:337 (+),score=37.95 TRINITY_DN34038_c0_g1_i1:102-1013(+)